MRSLRALLLVGVLLGTGCSDDGGSSEGTITTLAAPTVDRWTVHDLPGRPAAIAVDGDELVVVDDADGTLTRIGADGRVGEPLAVGGPLVGVAPVGAGAAWVIDATGAATRVGPPEQSARPRVDLGGTLVDVVVAGDSVYVGDIERGVVHELEVSTGTERRELALPDGVVRLAVDGPRLWVTGGDHTVTPIDRATGVAGPAVDVGNGPIGMAVDGGTLWVANGDDATVSRIDTATGLQQGAAIPVGTGPVAVGVHGDDVWVLAQDAGTVTHLRASTAARAEPDLALPASLSRARDLVVTDAGVWVVGTDASQAAFLPTG